MSNKEVIFLVLVLLIIGFVATKIYCDSIPIKSNVESMINNMSREYESLASVESCFKNNESENSIISNRKTDIENLINKFQGK